MIRPGTVIREGMVEALEFPSNTFFADTASDLILFVGKEPNLHWGTFADGLLSVCTQFGVRTIYFVGGVSSLVPHTREPYLLCTVSGSHLKERFKNYGVKFANYEGPASFSTYLTVRCTQVGLDMISLIATIPVYVQGNNPKCIQTMTRRLAGILNLQIDLDDLRAITEEFERKLSDQVQQQPGNWAGNISKLEEDYDNDIFNHEMADFKEWLEQQGLRVD